MPARHHRLALRCIAITLFALTATPPALAQYGAADGEWRSYAGDNGSTKYSPLDQIDASNFSDLEIAWRWDSVDATVDIDALAARLVAQGTAANTNDGAEATDRPRISIRGLQATPLMVDGVLYLSTALYQVAAVHAGTGETIWVHNPESYNGGRPTHAYRSRGVAYWAEPDGSDARIFWGTNEAYLHAVDARTGEPVRSFGDNGRVDLTTGIPRADRNGQNYLGRNLMGVASPPVVTHDVVVTPTIISDFVIQKEAPPGWLKGIDARTGELKWTFRTVPQGDDFGADTWLNESWRYSGNANLWPPFSADDELGIFYLPLGTPTSDYYGGHRPGDNLFAESLVAVDAETGQRLWHFQAVHHGVWDYDFPAAPNLIDITVDGRDIRAVAQVSKQGFTYVFDRATGEPVWPIEERPVETDTDLEGEVLSPTQPFPTRPPPFEYQGMTIDDLVDFTPEIRQMAVAAVTDFRLGPLFTPPMLSHEGGLQGTIQRPHIAGGATWAGAAVDPETGMLYVPSANRFSVIKYYTPDPAEGGNLRYTQAAFDSGRQPTMPRGLPLLKPPYSRTTAIDMNRGEHAWMRPNGDGDRFRNHPMLRDLDLPPLGGEGNGGPVLTKTLLISALSAGGSDGGPRLIARDKATGEIVGSVDLPAGAIGVPMTYMHEGRQYIALTIGGDVPQLIALTLPAAAQVPSGHSDADGWAAPATPWGDPDLQGVWDYRTLTPLERPEEFADRTVATEEEAAEYELRANAVRDARTTVHAVWWLDYGRELTTDRRTSLIVDPSDGRIPETTDAAQARAAARRERSQQHAADGPTFRGLTERCITFGIPPVPGPYNNNYLIVQTPDHVVLFSEMIHDARIVPLDGRDRPADDIRLWSGVARGHWEGDTLVVVSTHFSPKASHRGSTEELRLEERFTRVGPETITYSATLSDPQTWTRPWTFSMPMTRTGQATYEYACHEGNYGLRNILHNARHDDDPDYLAKLPSPASR